MSYAEKWMRRALRCAKAAFTADEAPIGAVIVQNGEVVATGRNMREKKRNALLHAEIVAIDRACKRLGAWRLEGCDIYVTLEPCQMCAGAIVQARIPRVVIGSMNPKAGCAGSILNILQIPTFNHQCEITKGVCEEECSEMLTTFFKELRKNKKKNTDSEKIINKMYLGSKA